MRAIILLLTAALWCGVACAQVPQNLNYQGFLTGADGTPVSTPVPMVFKLYSVAAGGAALYVETQVVTVNNGVFNVVLGSAAALNLPFDVPYYLGVAVDGDAEMTPRQPVTASPYALTAATANALAPSATVGATQITGPIDAATLGSHPPSYFTIAGAAIVGSQITGPITTATLPTGNLTGTIGTAQIANNAVTQAQLSPLSGAAAGKVLGTDGTNLQWQTASGGGSTITGSGTLNFLSKWSPNGTTLGNSAIFESAGNVGIGTTTPVNQLQIGNTPGFSSNDLAIGNGSNAMSFFQSAEASIWYSSSNFALMPNGGNGLVGIGTTTPASKLQIGSVGTTGYAGDDIAFGNGAQASGIAQTASVAQWYSTTNVGFMPNGGKGSVGIGTTTPVNKLQVGSVGATGFVGNDIAFGNGAQASGMAQTANVAQWYSTTNIALMPQGNGQGQVGINTTTPGYPLEVDNYISRSNGYRYINYANDGLQIGNFSAQVSILATNNVVAAEFDAESDSRIKSIVGISDSAKDLKTINELKITDYTLKDKATNGNRPFKKIIAQQVETVYPQVVSRHVGFIPNVYQAASSVTKTAGGYLLHFDNAHQLSAQAKDIKLLASADQTMQRASILAIPSDKDVVIDAPRLNGNKVFVYGEEVQDFRAVDYEGLTALNISATQELTKQLVGQQADMAARAVEQDSRLAELRQQLATQTTEIALLKQDRQEQMAHIDALAEQAAEITALKKQVARMARLQERGAQSFALDEQRGTK